MARTHMALPHSQTGLRTRADGTLSEADDIPMPRCGPTGILVRVHSVALNPSDYKIPGLLLTAGLQAGCDFAGEIVQVGSEAGRVCGPSREPWAVGERVCGAVHGCNVRYPGWGAFAQFVEADPVVLIRLPEGWAWTHGAAVGGSCIGAVGLALFYQMGLRLTRLVGDSTGEAEDVIDAKDPRNTVLVYGGSTACGTMALQMLQLAGYRPITVCSPQNRALTESYGSVACFDYHSDQCAQQILAYTQNSLSLVLDCISTADSAALCYAAIGRAGGRYVGLEKLPNSVTDARKAVRASWAMGPLMFGRQIDMDEYSSNPDDSAREFGRRWYALAEALLKQRRLQCHPVREVGGEQNWVSAVQHGLRTLQAGKISGEKLVVRVI